MLHDQPFRHSYRSGDIHNIARVSHAYGKLNSFLDQRMVVRDQYPPNRHTTPRS